MKRTLLLVFLAALSFLSQGAVIYVDSSASGLNDGSSWANAAETLTDGLALAVSGDEIWVAVGNYKPTTGTSRSVAFSVPDGVNIYGGFDGSETARSQRNWDENPCVLSGDIGIPVTEWDNSLRIIQFSGSGILDGFTVEWAYYGPADTGSFGALAAVLGGTVTIEHCVFRYNTGPHSPAVLSNGSDILIQDCLFHDNFMEIGGIVSALAGTTMEIAQCTFSENIPDSDVCLCINTDDDSSVEIYNTIFWENDMIDAVSSLDDAILDQCILEAAPSAINVVYLDTLMRDPLFNSPIVRDFSLASGSPAIDYGANAYSSNNRDLAFNIREWNGAVDAGCYEYQSERILHVDPSASGNGNGNTWANAFTNLTDALAAALPGDELWIVGGTYYPTDDNNRDIAFQIPPDISLYGGFDGTENNRWERDWTAHPVIISGAIGNGGDLTDNSKNLFWIDDAGEEIEIDGLNFRRAYVGPAETDPSGAVRILSGFVKMKHCKFSINTGNGASAVYLSIAELRMDNCSVFQNHTETGASVFQATSSSITTVYNSTFSDNTHTDALAYELNVWGGAQLNVFNTIIWGNDQGTIGTSGTVTVDHCLVQGGFPSGTNILDSNPGFENANNNNYKLTHDSPARDAGDNTHSNLNLDLDHAERIFGATVDMGAFEYNNSHVIHVDLDATGDNDGSSWEHAYTDLQDALAAFDPAREIWVAEGIYLPSFADRTASFEMPDNAQLYGGFNGTEFFRNERDPESNVTTLSGDVGDPGNQFDNSYSVVLVNNAETVTLDGFTITLGFGDGGSPDDSGGGIRNVNSILWLTDCIVQTNYAEKGGGIYLTGGATVNIDSSTLDNNTSGSGGGLYIGFGTTVNCSNSTISTNSALIEGAATLVLGSLSINNSAITGNYSVGLVPGISVQSNGLLIAEDCLFSDQQGLNDLGALILRYGATAVVSRCRFTNNTSDGDYAGILVENGILTMDNCLFDLNESNNIPALGVLADGTAFVSNCTFTKNTAETTDAIKDIVGLAGNGGWFTNNIVWDNTDEEGIIVFGLNTDPEDCIIQGGVIGTNIFDSDPGFINPDSENYRIGTNSFAYDRGSDASAGGLTDLDGNNRIMFNSVDIGCYEAQLCGVIHDLCVDAIALEVGAEPVFASNECSSDNGNPAVSCAANAGNSIWYKFFAPSSGAANIISSQVSPLSNNFNMKITGYSGGCGNLSELLCVNIYGNGQAETLELTGLIPDNIYRIRIEGGIGQEAQFFIQVEEGENSCPGDFNNDGLVNTNDLLSILSGFGCISGCIYDMDGDDAVSTSDLLTFLGVFGTSCGG